MLIELYFWSFILFSMSLLIFSYQNCVILKRKTQNLKLIILFYYHICAKVHLFIPGHLHKFFRDSVWQILACETRVLQILLVSLMLELSALHLLVRKVNGNRSCRCLNFLCHTNYHPWAQAICQAWDTLKKERKNILEMALECFQKHQIKRVFKLTKIDDFQCTKKHIFKLQVLWRGFGAVVFDERESTSPKDVVVRSLHLPVEVGQTELVIDDVTVAHAERSPGRERALCEVTC